ncbi:sugar ABC transporter permease [Paenibacillus sp. CGMCC 1.16610]|uniref:ABC transporter permease subunit n=1 Tax=Paenibacillus anseongense TaxID=2682845 RepID=A0ABW9U5J4_9BACL|nr:sugar ABC transporter permease [Paenibacillus sp. CGMCC 1.16610]MBA2942560.1 sugar ABC transporter permease [Paenibacillus sp. CGMCC 1.16610]MVQ35374.1 ABC transporter permease subunit [Paenibacillus anseongense]
MITKEAAAYDNKPIPKSRERIIVKSRSRRKTIEAWTGLCYALPALALLLLFRYWPLLFGMWMSLWKWGYVPERFVGFDNYIRIFTEDLVVQDPTVGLQLGPVGQGFMVTVFYAIGTIPLSLLLSFFVAYVLFHITKGRTLLRVLFFLPYITSQVAAAIVFKWIFHPSVGLANWAVNKMGGMPQQWLTDPDPILMKLIQSLGGHWPSSIPTAFAGPTWALGVIMLFTIWGSLGFQIVVFLSGLTQIPHDLTESARIDGARTWHTIRHITLPLLSPTWFLLIIVSVIGAFESFNAFYVFSGGEGGPLGSTMSLPLYIFRSFYVYGQVGYASAVSMVLFVLLLGLTWLQLRYGEKKVHYMH